MKEEFKEFRLDYFYNSYENKDNCHKQKFRKIVNLFFEVVIDEILNGVIVKLPYLGIFKTVQKKSTKPSIDHHQTRINKANGVEDYIVYRKPNEHYYAFAWDRNLSRSAEKYHAKSNFLFNASSGNERKIPKYFDILEVTHA